MHKIAIIFSGQGSQYVGMGKDLYYHYPTARRVFDDASKILGQDITELLFQSDEERLRLTENAQLAVFITSMAAYNVFSSECSIKPIVAAGHSLGEISALTAAGALDFEDAVLLVRDRAQYMKLACDENKGTMCAIREIHPNIVKDMCARQDSIWISNLNSKKQVVISGEEAAVRNMAERLSLEGAVVNNLVVSGAFHSPLMKSASVAMQHRVENLTIHEPKIPVVSNTTARITSKEEIRDNLYKQIIMPVRWCETIDLFSKMSVNASVEFGAGHTLSNMIKVNNDSIKTFLFEKDKDIKITIEAMKTKYRDKKPSYFEKCLSIAICAKNSNEDISGYNIGVINNVGKIKALIEKNVDDLSNEDRVTAHNALKEILAYKRVSVDEMESKLSELYFAYN